MPAYPLCIQGTEFGSDSLSFMDVEGQEAGADAELPIAVAVATHSDTNTLLPQVS
jgi:hypothetical protein